ncbi:MAG TPA: hypothetical protein VL527_17420 [Dongiaceae bacterium]|nr:hypothetical protein [Dongiaceae bacterium]
MKTKRHGRGWVTLRRLALCSLTIGLFAGVELLTIHHCQQVVATSAAACPVAPVPAMASANLSELAALTH